MPLAMLKATIDTKIYAFKGTDGLYDGEIATATGIEIAAANDQDLPEYTVKELLQKGILRRVVARVTVGTKKRTLKLLVAKDKLATALDALKNQSFSFPSRGGTTSGTINSISFGIRVVSKS